MQNLFKTVLLNDINNSFAILVGWRSSFVLGTPETMIGESLNDIPYRILKVESSTCDSALIKKVMKTQTAKDYEKMPMVHLNAAGIDVGSKSHYVAIGQQPEDVREFGCYTNDLHLLCGWLKSVSVQTVALESTGSYWRSLFVLLQAYGLNPILVNGKYTKNVKGKKTDVLDCQWIQKLHTLGLLEGSFIPDLFTETLRQYCRHRHSLIEDASGYISKMQKALRLTNIRLDIALADITGVSGKAILEAIIAGERDPEKLASLVNGNVKKSHQEIVMALTGDWREEYLFELKQSYEVYSYFHQKVNECDDHIDTLLNLRIEDNERTDGEARPEYTPGGRAKKKGKNDPKIDLAKLSYQLTGGVDLYSVEGIGRSTLMSILSEIGVDLKAFPTAKHFTSWLRLSPNNRISGGKVITRRTPKGKNQLADALRHAANGIGNGKEGSLCQFFKRITIRKGRLAAITATARKLAVIIYNMLTKKQAYQPQNQLEYLTKIRMNQIKNMQRRINQLKVLPQELVFVTS